MPMSMPGMAMPEVAMPAVGVFDLCPVVIGLGMLALSLGAWAIVAYALERHRAVARHRLLGAVAALPLVRACIGLAAVSALPIALIIVVDGGAPSSLESWLLLGALVVGGSTAATIAGVAAARFGLALGRRLVVRIARALRIPLPPAVVSPRSRRSTRVGSLQDVCVLAAGRGLRAPPLSAR